MLSRGVPARLTALYNSIAASALVTEKIANVTTIAEFSRLLNRAVPVNDYEWGIADGVKLIAGTGDPREINPAYLALLMDGAAIAIVFHIEGLVNIQWHNQQSEFIVEASRGELAMTARGDSRGDPRTDSRADPRGGDPHTVVIRNGDPHTATTRGGAPRNGTFFEKNAKRNQDNPQVRMEDIFSGMLSRGELTAQIRGQSTLFSSPGVSYFGAARGGDQRSGDQRSGDQRSGDRRSGDQRGGAHGDSRRRGNRNRSDHHVDNRSDQHLEQYRGERSHRRGPRESREPRAPRRERNQNVISIQSRYGSGINIIEPLSTAQCLAIQAEASKHVLNPRTEAIAEAVRGPAQVNLVEETKAVLDESPARVAALQDPNKAPGDVIVASVGVVPAIAPDVRAADILKPKKPTALEQLASADWSK